jgi:hypothetical protein
MQITGPFLDKTKRDQPRPWFLRYSAPKINSDGTIVRTKAGKTVLQRFRPYYESKAKAVADIPRINEQHAAIGSGNFLFDRNAATEFESAKKIAGDVSLTEVAKFWRLHHPEKPKAKLGELLDPFLKSISIRLGEGRHWNDRKSRIKAFLAGGFAERYPDTVTRTEVMSYVTGVPDAAPRTIRNHKTAVCEFFNWMLQEKHVLANPATGIKKKMLPRDTPKEIRFLSLDEVARYLRAAERYEPALVAHEIVQLIAGVRADDEMADFLAEYVMPQTKQVLIPASVAKTEKREVIQGLEDNFWTWWKAYGPKEGKLRPKNYGPKWDRIRVLASAMEGKEADELAQIPIKILLRMPSSRAALKKWPWNARRRTFCTYHVAKQQSADKTALIMRHRGSPYTLHQSYRGLGVTQEEGVRYFDFQPTPVENPIAPSKPAKSPNPTLS